MGVRSTFATGLCSGSASPTPCTPTTRSGYTATQHLSANHVVVFDAHDSDRARCSSAMYAQHHSTDGDGHELLILRGWYDNHLLRVADEWKIERLVQHVSWREIRPAELEG